MGTDAQVTTFHTYYGSSLLMHKKSLIAFAGLRVCLPVELEPADISKFSVNSNVPNLDSLLNVNNLSDLDAVQPDPNIMEKVRNVAILPPKIATELLTMTDISPVQVLLRVLKTIKKFETDLIHEISLPDPDYGEEEKSDLSTEEEIFLTVREDSKLEYGEMLISLWKLAYNSPRVEPIRCLPISDNRRQVFLQHLCHANHSDVNMTPLPPLPPTPAPDLTKWATSMSKVAQAWEKKIARKEKNEEDKQDKGKKNWEALSDIQRKTILFAGTPNDLVPPDSPTEMILVILKSGTGARVQTILHHELHSRNCIVHLDPGLCVGAKNGLFLSQPTESSINYYSPIFTPPELHLRAFASDDSGLLISEQAANGKFSHEEIVAMTKQNITYPKNYEQLKHTTNNFRELMAILFGEEAIMTQALTELHSHVEMHERKYCLPVLPRPVVFWRSLCK